MLVYGIDRRALVLFGTALSQGLGWGRPRSGKACKGEVFSDKVRGRFAHKKRCGQV